MPALLFLWALSAGGCRGPRGAMVLSSNDPASKIPAMKLALARHDAAAAAQLIKDLDSDDPAVRFYAINTLRRLTGENFGYVYWEDEARRKPALEKWNVWLAGGGTARDGPPAPASAPTATAPTATAPTATAPATEEVRGAADGN